MSYMNLEIIQDSRHISNNKRIVVGYTNLTKNVVGYTKF